MNMFYRANCTQTLFRYFSQSYLQSQHRLQQTNIVIEH